ncbi:MAG TPA: hypothetical protein VLA82_07170 [Actinomycetota bacterium]|nr:hypothetical protein [Actinomycetota bacterium]
MAAAVLPLALVAAVIVVGTAATSGPADPTPDEGAEGTPSVSMAPFLPPLTGSIVYSRRSPSADRVQLWIWDLERGDVIAGSVLPRPLEIVGASVAGRGRVGVTWRRGDGVLQAAVVDPSDVEAEPELIVEGDLVAWSARGSRVTAATLTRGAPCPQRVTIDAVRLQPDVRLVEAPSELRTCGDVLGLETDGAVSYFTYRSGRRLHVAYPGVRRPTIVLRDHELLSASWAGDMIVRPIGRRREGALAYFNRKTTDPSAAPVAFNADATFAFGGVLAWAPNSFEALVLGVSSGRPSPTPGIYALDTLPTDGIDPPRWVMEASGPTSATFTRDGVAIVATGGDVFAVHDGGVSPMALPVGAPLLDGRIAWIP